MAHLKRLLHDEAGLGHGAFGRVDEHENAVDHHHYALHLARKVGVTRRVDDVYFYAVVVNGRIFGENGYAPLALKSVGIHNPLVDVLVIAEGVALLEHCVDKGGFAVVDVGYYCYVS